MMKMNRFTKEDNILVPGLDIVKALKQMIRFSPTGELDKESRLHFKVLIPKDTTVRDIIDFALSQDEWGTISVKHNGVTSVLDYERKTIDGKKGTIKYDEITDEVKAMKVKNITSYGGWSRMDYKITV